MKKFLKRSTFTSGFACVRRVPNGLSFQPFYADNAETAERLIIKCRSKNWKNETVQFFVPDGNDECREILKNYYKIIHEYPNTWLGNKSTFSVDEKNVFHFGFLLLCLLILFNYI